MFNLTNPYDVVFRGAKPIYQELPRVAYRHWMKKFNISFSRDQNNVYFLQRDWFDWDPVESGNNFNPYTNYVYNINPSYLGVMLQTGGEKGLWKAMSGGAVEQIVTLLATVFPDSVMAGYRPFVTKMQYDIVVANVTENEFYAIWSNAFQPPNPLFKDMLLSEGYHTPTNIPQSTAKALFDLSTDYSLVNMDPDQTDTWTNASLGDESAIQTIMQQFPLTREQVNRIGAWFPRFQRSYVYPYMQSQFIDPVTKETIIKSPADLGWLQWAAGTVNPYGSVTEGPGAVSLPGYPEIYYYAKYVLGQEITYDLELSKTILNGTVKPLFDKDNVLLFLNYYDNKDYASINNIWNLDQEHGELFGKYLYYVMQTFVNDTLIHDVFEKDVGLISKRTVNEWMMTYTDPLMILLQQPATNTTLMVNQTSDDEVYNTYKISSQNTGHYNLSWVGEFLSFNGQETLTLWNEPVPIIGTDGTVFGPGLTEDSTIYIWFPDVMRPQNFTFREVVYHHGVKCFRFKLKYEMMMPNHIFNNDFWAMANMTVLGSPIFVSKWYFLHSEPWWTTLIEGLKAPNPDFDTTLDVEPITGIGMDEHKRVQINAYIQNKTKWFDIYHPNVPTGVMYPLAMVEEYATITENLANQFKNSVYAAQTARSAVFWVFVAGFIILCVIGFALVFKSYDANY
jgi:hypothetical protein